MRTILVAMVAMVALVVGGCAPFVPFRVVPSTRDEAAWRQPWVAEERAEHDAWVASARAAYARFAAHEARERCDRINWGNFGISTEQRPWECPPK